ncbi:MAG TPA: hypothetical protein VLA88_00920 [Candidatus Saccharimonadales bacterium]|nr:hypothetical protein [Candidatus Saccharimonadales bacterium]
MTRYVEQLEDRLAHCHTKSELVRTIVDAPFAYPIEAAQLYLGIMVLLLVDKKTGLIDRVALSNTELAKGTTDISVKKFEDIKIPVDHPENVIAQAIRTGDPKGTADWQYLFTPVLSAEEARFNQAAGAIAFSAVYPLVGVVEGGALIFSYYQYPENIGHDQRKFMAAYSRVVAERLASFST